jgi:hypothetical protein
LLELRVDLRHALGALRIERERIGPVAALVIVGSGGGVWHRQQLFDTRLLFGGQAHEPF